MLRSFSLLFALLLLGCKQSNDETPAAVLEKTIADPVSAVNKTNAVIDTFLIGNQRDTLFLQFDTIRKSAVLRFNGEPILLQSQPTASGIRYTNADFEYVEWHGESKLKKDGKVIFSKP